MHLVFQSIKFSRLKRLRAATPLIAAHEELVRIPPALPQLVDKFPKKLIRGVHARIGQRELVNGARIGRVKAVFHLPFQHLAVCQNLQKRLLSAEME